MKNFLRYHGRHSLYFPGNWQFPKLDPISSSSHVQNKDGTYSKKRTITIDEPRWIYHLRKRLFSHVGYHWCGRRGPNPSLQTASHHGDIEEPDSWDKGVDGYRVCSYCGSLHEDDFWDIADKYMSGDPDYEVTFTDKDYKLYARKRSTKNASLGAIKFYLHHVNFSHPLIEERKSKYQKLHRFYVERFNEMIKRAPAHVSEINIRGDN